jgi:hypothetical protein
MEKMNVNENFVRDGDCLKISHDGFVQMMNMEKNDYRKKEDMDNNYAWENKEEEPKFLVEHVCYPIDFLKCSEDTVKYTDFVRVLTKGKMYHGWEYKQENEGGKTVGGKASDRLLSMKKAVERANSELETIVGGRFMVIPRNMKRSPGHEKEVRIDWKTPPVGNWKGLSKDGQEKPGNHFFLLLEDCYDYDDTVPRDKGGKYQTTHL